MKLCLTYFGALGSFDHTGRRTYPYHKSFHPYIISWTGIWICCWYICRYICIWLYWAGQFYQRPYLLIIPKHCPRYISLEWMKKSVIDKNIFFGIFHISLFQVRRVFSIEKKKVYILLGSTLLNTFWQAAEYFRRKIENEITEKDFVTEENRNQPINRNQSMWMRRNRVDISEEYRVPKCIWIKALGWVYPISNDVEFTIFSILNSFRFTSKLKSGFLDFSKTCQFTSGMYRSRGRALIANSIHDFWGEENQTIESLF